MSGVKCSWIMQNNEPILSTLENLNKRNKGNSLYSFDFSTLCTNKAHETFLHIFSELIDIWFKHENMIDLGLSVSTTLLKNSS